MKKEEGFPGQISFVIPERILGLVKENPLSSDLYITDIGYYPEARFHFRERPAGTAQFILIYCLSGKGEIWLNNNLHELSADHYFIIPAGMPHSYRSDERDPWSIYWIHFAGKRRHATPVLLVRHNPLNGLKHPGSMIDSISFQKSSATSTGVSALKLWNMSISVCPICWHPLPI